jgi:hypothetical protein
MRAMQMVRVVNINDMFAKFRADPCLVDTGFLRGSFQSIERICREIEVMRIGLARLEVAVLNRHATAQL